jgi:hypothetical protein
MLTMVPAIFVMPVAEMSIKAPAILFVTCPDGI